MSDTTGNSLPPRMSDRQQFSLAWLTQAGERTRERREQELTKARESDGIPYFSTTIRRHNRKGDARWTNATGLSWAAAREFDGWEDTSPKTDEEIYAEYDDALGAAETDAERDEVRRQYGLRLERREQARHDHYIRKDETLTTNHRTTHSRMLNRLEERGLIERGRAGVPRGGEPLPDEEHRQTQKVRVTDGGERAGREILRRHNDGRYSLHFDTLEHFADEFNPDRTATTPPR